MKKQSCGKLSLAFGRDQLSFLEHVHEQDALQDCSDRMKGYEPEHWPDNPFDRLMPLLRQIVQVI